MTTYRPKFSFTRDKQTYLFPLICCECGNWFSSIGDMHFHFRTCNVSTHTLLCGHCGMTWTHWPHFADHINKKGMISELPCSDIFSWSNKLDHSNTDMLATAMQAIGLPSTLPNSNLPEIRFLYLPSLTTTDTTPTFSNPISIISSFSSQPCISPHLEIPISLWQTVANLFSYYLTHFHILQHITSFLACLLANHQKDNRHLTDREQHILHLFISNQFWPNNFAQIANLRDLLFAIEQYCTQLQYFA